MHLCIFYELYQVCSFAWSFMIVADALTNGSMFLFNSYPDIHLYNVFRVLVVWAVAQVQSFSHRRRFSPLDHRYPFPTDSPFPNSCFVFLRCGYQSIVILLRPSRHRYISIPKCTSIFFFLPFFLVYPTRHAPLPSTSHPRFCPLCSSIP